MTRENAPKLSREIMVANGISVASFRVVDYAIAPGVRPDMTEHGADSDDWPKLSTPILEFRRTGTSRVNGTRGVISIFQALNIVEPGLATRASGPLTAIAHFANNPQVAWPSPAKRIEQNHSNLGDISMIKSILVPVDGSDFSEGALPIALQWCGAFRAHLHVVTVVSPTPLSTVPLTPDAALHPEEQVIATTHADQYLQNVVEGLPGGDQADVQTTVLGGADVANEILGFAETQAVDLIVATTHGRGPLARTWLGSTADTLLRANQLPLLLVRPESVENVPSKALLNTIRTILVPVDETEEARSVIALATKIAKAFGASLVLLHIVPAPVLYSSGFTASEAYAHVDPDEVEASLTRATARLERLAEPLRAEGISVSTKTEVNHSAAQAIAEWEQPSPDLIVMGSEGRSGVLSVLTQSVTDKVVRSAKCPVLSVPIR